MDTTTNPSRNIVVGVDGSERDSQVVAIAATLARRLGHRLRLVHAVDPDTLGLAEDHRRALRRATHLVANASPRYPDEDRLAVLGDPASALRAAMSPETALVVVGSRGRGPLRAALLGSVSNALAASASSPVLVVPDEAHLDDLDQLAVVSAVDGSVDAGNALRHANVLAEALDAELVAVDVRDLLRPGLAKIAEEYPSAILVVGSRGRTAGRAALLGSTSATLAARARTPVLIVPPTARRPETLARAPSAAVGVA